MKKSSKVHDQSTLNESLQMIKLQKSSSEL